MRMQRTDCWCGTHACRLELGKAAAQRQAQPNPMLAEMQRALWQAQGGTPQVCLCNVLFTDLDEPCLGKYQQDGHKLRLYKELLQVGTRVYILWRQYS